MHTTKDYSNSPTPNFDAVEDLKDYFGAGWDKINQLMAQEQDAFTFLMQCSMFLGIEGRPVQAWWELNKGQGTWAWDYPRDEAAACIKAYEAGLNELQPHKATFVYGHVNLQRCYDEGLAFAKANTRHSLSA